jgi:hypothetical protein
MGNTFSSGNQPQKLFGVKVNSSELGHAWTVVMGCAKTNQSLLWIDGFAANSAGSKKGGGGGGKGGKGGDYIYSADVVAGLCAGPIVGIGDVWSGQSWLGSPTASESYTIASPYTYTPTNAASIINNYGVSPVSTYSGSTYDFGAPGDTSFSNISSIPYVQVVYGTTLTAGTYSIDPATGIYHFSPADVGVTIDLYYSYLLTYINQQENDIVPAGRTVEVGGSAQFNADLGVTYGGTGSDFGTALTKVSGTPTVTGTYSQTGSAPATYTFASGDIGAEVTITFQVYDPDAVGQNETTMLDFTTSAGTIGQAPYSYLSASYPGAALGYTGIATLLYEPMDLGEGGEPQENSFEVITPDGYGGGILDCNPVTCVARVLTDSTWGLGVGAVPFPPSFMDTGSGGTWGAPGTPGVQQVGTSAWNWFAANNFFISPVLDSQDTAASTVSKWLEAGMCAAFVSEGLLKLVPYGDTSAAANGCTWTAPSTFVVALDDTCFIAKDGVDPVSIKRSAWQDAFNDVQVQWSNRKNQYSQEITEESDQALINRFGARIEDPQDWNFITTLPAATFAASMRLKHNTYIRNEYTFTLPYTYAYLEPMDICTISTTSVWAMGLNNINLGITDLPVRITKVVDDPTDGLQITAEDAPFGAGQPVVFNKGISASEVVVNTFADPGTSEVVLFEASGRLTGYTGNEIWLGATGTGATYGATNVWVSQDNLTYIKVTTLGTPSILGKLTSAFASGSDPDTTNTLVVQLAENCPPLAAGTTTAADNDTMMCYVGGEIISYSAAAATAQNTYTLGTYIRRGQMGTTIGSHASGSLFLRLDNSIFRYQYDPTWQGKTVYFKFQAVNNFGNNPQPLSNLTAVTFAISSGNTGVTQGSSSGLNSQGSIVPTTLITLSSSFTASSVTMTWTSQSMLRADGSTLTIPSGSNTWTGLSSSTAYYIYPTINATTGAITFTNPSPPTTSPSSTYAIQSGADGYVALPVYIVTTASGGGTGGGSTGGGGTCPEAAELVDVQGKGNVPAGSVVAGDRIRGMCFGSGSDIWRKVIHTEHIPCVAWRMVEGHRVSPCEPVYVKNEWMPAYRAPGATLDTLVGTKVHITVDCGDYNEANYYLTNGQQMLIHNYPFVPC